MTALGRNEYGEVRLFSAFIFKIHILFFHEEKVFLKITNEWQHVKNNPYFTKLCQNTNF